MQLHGKTEAIPDGVGALSKLEILSLDGNRITELPDAMASGAALIVVHLNQNRLRTLPEWLANLPALAHLNVRGNPEIGRAHV